ncbi:hypothetical protein KY290_034708 [Solanum tuberosum]|uniref:Uncharacterized protein n=1 Tax=Solanum tuberosum TaxID=4113 RepID=A0ABQ7U7J9_SOLTU|nr:hypothetical protein KY289_034077 [Solanum tuberosum]KAH0741665.1 hypothetical protein KY290_034708 [Solanum tuberosum]
MSLSLSASKTIRHLVIQQYVIKQIADSRLGLGNHAQVQCLSGIAGVPSYYHGYDAGSKVIKSSSSRESRG